MWDQENLIWACCHFQVSLLRYTEFLFLLPCPSVRFFYCAYMYISFMIFFTYVILKRILLGHISITDTQLLIMSIKEFVTIYYLSFISFCLKKILALICFSFCFFPIFMFFMYKLILNIYEFIYFEYFFLFIVF